MTSKEDMCNQRIVEAVRPKDGSLKLVFKLKPFSCGPLEHEKDAQKLRPRRSYESLIKEAFLQSQCDELHLKEITALISNKFPYFKTLKTFNQCINFRLSNSSNFKRCGGDGVWKFESPNSSKNGGKKNVRKQRGIRNRKRPNYFNIATWKTTRNLKRKTETAKQRRRKKNREARACALQTFTDQYQTQLETQTNLAASWNQDQAGDYDISSKQALYSYLGLVKKTNNEIPGMSVKRKFHMLTNFDHERSNLIKCGMKVEARKWSSDSPCSFGPPSLDSSWSPGSETDADEDSCMSDVSLWDCQSQCSSVLTSKNSFFEEPQICSNASCADSFSMNTVVCTNALFEKETERTRCPTPITWHLSKSPVLPTIDSVFSINYSKISSVDEVVDLCSDSENEADERQPPVQITQPPLIFGTFLTWTRDVQETVMTVSVTPSCAFPSLAVLSPLFFDGEQTRNTVNQHTFVAPQTSGLATTNLDSAFPG